MSIIDQKQKQRIIEKNIAWNNHPLGKIFDKGGESLFLEINKDFKNPDSISLLCGNSTNTGYLLSAAKYFVNNTETKVFVYLFGRVENYSIPELNALYLELKSLEKLTANLYITQDATEKYIEKSDIVIESLVNNHTESKLTESKLTERISKAVAKVNKFDSIRISIDFPTQKFNASKKYSTYFPKADDSSLLSIGVDENILSECGPGEVIELDKPDKNDYKTKTGELFVFGGSESFHGAPMMAIMAASKFIGSVYYYTTPNNRLLTRKIQEEVYEFINVNDEEIEKYASYADAILIGPGLIDNIHNRGLINRIFELYPNKPKIIDAYAIAMAPKDKLSNCILTPHRGELRHLWGDETNLKTKRLEGNLKRYAIEHECTIILKGHVDILFSPSGEVAYNKTGNAGMAKGGTGDVLSGLVGAFLTKNDSWIASKAAIFINGFAGDLAYKEFGFNFSATDIVPYLQKAVKICNDLKQ